MQLLQKTYKMLIDEKRKRVAKAKADAQAKIDAAKAVKLDNKDKLDLMKKIGVITKTEKTDDPEEAVKNQKKALNAAIKFRKEYRADLKILKKESIAAKKASGNTS